MIKEKKNNGTKVKISKDKKCRYGRKEEPDIIRLKYENITAVSTKKYIKTQNM